MEFRFIDPLGGEFDDVTHEEVNMLLEFTLIGGHVADVSLEHVGGEVSQGMPEGFLFIVHQWEKNKGNGLKKYF